MPTYQYVCTDCGGQLEVVQKFSDDPLTKHDACGGKLRKVFSPVGIVFKGSGFYRTDSRNGSSGSTVSPATANGNGGTKSDKSEKSGENGSSAEKKTETTASSSSSSSSSSSGSGSSSGSSSSATKVA